MGKRTWIKVYCDKWITGSLRQESAELRGLWVDLLTLVGASANSDKGILTLTNGIGYTDPQISEIFNVPVDQWVKVKQQLIETERISVDSLNTINIINWSKYQSEYQRQKPYRDNKPVNDW